MNFHRNRAFRQATEDIETKGYLTTDTKRWLKNLGLDPVSEQLRIENQLTEKERYNDEQA